MSDRGIYRKYEVRRTDGTHAECAYFVLDLACDEFAIPALKAYIRACKKTKPELARDLKTIIETRRTRCNCREISCPHSLGQAMLPDGPSEQAHIMMAEADEAKP
jgi:NADPH-dependent ferric siderophore reductase